MALSLRTPARAGFLLLALQSGLGSCRPLTETAGLDPAPPGPPVLALSTTGADFSAILHGVAPMQVVAISNAGAGTLGGLGIEGITYYGDATGWLTASLSALVAPATLSLQAAAGNLPEGTYYATLNLAATGAANSPRPIAVSFRVDAPAVGPIIGLSAVSATLSAVAGSVGPPQQVHVLPASDSPLSGLTISDVSYDAAGSGWLRATLLDVVAPTEVVLLPDASTLLPGSYAALVTVAAPGAINSPRTIRILLNVTTAPVPPVLQLSTTAIGASGSTASPPGTQTVAISNAGGGSIEGLSAGPPSYGPGATGWLSTSLSATAAPAILSLTPSVTGLAPGTYSASVPVRSTTAGISPQGVQVTLTVLAAPASPSIALTPGSVSFSATAGGASPAVKSVAVNNSGGGTLSGLGLSAISYSGGGSGWLTATLDRSTAPATITLTPQTGTLAAGSYGATLQVLSSVAANSPQTVVISLTVASAPLPPTIGLSSSAVSLVATAGGAAPSPSLISVTNAGGGTLSGLSAGTISYGAGATGWATATLSSATAPASLSISAAPGSLAAGTYTATVPVLSGTASNSPQLVTVTFTVSTVAVPPTIALSPGSLSFSATAGGASPTAKLVTVSNAGGGSLSGLAVGTISYGAGATGWLNASLNTTTAPATLTVTPTLGSLAAGSYTATVPVTAAGASNSPQTVSITFSVAAAPPPPAIALSPASLTFGATAGGSSPVAQTVGVSNSGGGTLSGLAVGTISYGAGATGWLNASLNTTTAPATLTVTPTLGSLAAGSYTATVPVTGSGASNSPQTLSVTLSVAAGVPPAITLTPNSLTFTATAGGTAPAPKTVGVSNGGGGTLSGLAVGAITYGAGGTGWAAASLSSTTAPATVTVTSTPGSLGAGTYTATVPVTAAGASNTPQSIAVTLTVSAASGTVSFKTDIYPTFQGNCLSSGCHVPGQQKPDLSSATAAYSSLVLSGTKYVVPGDSTTGLLLGVLQGTSGPVMPPTGKLSTSFITKVKTWIKQGAPNN